MSTLLAAALCAPSLAYAQQFRWIDACASSPTCVTNTSLPSSPVWPTGVMLPGDMDLDGDTDVVMVGGGLGYLQNDMVLRAAPSFGAFTDASASVTLALANVTDGVLADFDLDGDLDLAVVTNPFGGGSVFLLRNTPNTALGTLTLDDAALAGWSAPAFGAFTSVAASDFDGDGDPDLLVGGTGGLTLLANGPGPAGARVFVDVTAATVGAFVGSVADLAVGDFDADGDPDVAIAGGAVGAPIRTVATNPGPGLLWGIVPIPGAPVVTGFPTTVEASDLDGDGAVDLLYGFPTIGFVAPVWLDGQLEAYAGTGLGAFALAQVFSGLQDITDVAVGDVDEDGLVDVLASCRTAAGVGFPTIAPRTRMFSRPGPGMPFAEITDGGPGMVRVEDDGLFDGESVALADLDLDLDLELIVGHRLSMVPGIFSNLLWQLDVPRSVPLQQIVPSNQDQTDIFFWDVPYELFCESNVPNFGGGGGIGIVAASLTAPVHVFPAGPDGFVTTAPWVSGPVVVAVGPGSFTMRLGPFDAATAASFMGTTVFGQAGTLSLGRGIVRLSNVVQTTLQ